MKRRTKTLLLCILIFIVAVSSALGIWFLVAKKSTNGNVLGVEWYDEDGTEFTITTVSELYELAELSEHYDFKDQTIKLGADIVVNEGEASEWEFVLPEYVWDSPIANFAGTFDGQGHTISGLCGMGELYGVSNNEIIYFPTGLFTNTQTSCTIKNLNLKNSIFRSDLNEGVGSITNNGGGHFENIYSDALILSYKSHNGGLIGMLDGKGASTITNCWFDGEIRVEGNVGRYTGGIVGRVCNTGGQNKIEHCLNTASMTNSVTGKGVNMGGIVGNIAPSGRVTITDCLNTGDLKNEYGVAVGSVIGNIEGQGSANITDVYSKAESYNKIVGYIAGQSIGNPIKFAESMLTGYEGYRWTTLDFENYWTVVEDGTPILKSFATEIPSLKGIKKAYSIDWYDKTKSEYILRTKEDLYGFAILSYATNFSGRMVKLGADIVVNKGNAKEWGEKAPELEWLPVGTVGYPFDGIFDGNMHTISGIYLKTTEQYSGLFSTTTSNAKIQKFKLTNSYFETSALTFGSIAGRGRGIFDTIYSDAMVVSSSGNVAGLIGQVPSDGGVMLNNCWFDGTVVATGNNTKEKRTAGLLGTVFADSTLKNCLFTGTLDVIAYECKNSEKSQAIVPLVGGFIGHVNKEKIINIQDCLSAGEIMWSPMATAGYGSVIGWSDGNTLISGVYATSECCGIATGGTVTGQAIIKDAVDLTGTKGYQWTHLDFNTYWAATKSTPVLKSFATDTISVESVKKMIDVSWYDKEKKVYQLDSIEDLYGFYIMSYTTDFAGKTVKLGKNITFNIGNAREWSKKAPKYEWSPIGSAKYPFAGTFDGGMHTISGLFLKTDSRHGGLFAATGSTATIKNLKIENSYFETSQPDFGSIAGVGRGKFDTIYSNAIVICSNARVGGLIGQVAGDKTVMKNCWFDGIAKNTTNRKADRGIGGLAGYINANQFDIINCLNSGEIDATAYNFDQDVSTNAIVVPLVGGLIGNVPKEKKVNIEDSLNTGKILIHKAATAGYGSIVGWAEGRVIVSNTYASDACKKTMEGNKGCIVGNAKVLRDKELFGYAGYQWMMLDFDKYWTTVVNPNGAPILKSFATSVPSLAGVEKMLDISWYDPNKTEYVLMDKGDLFGFAMLSADYDFSGKTVKLGADIVVNEGNSFEWENSVPTYEWSPIGSNTLPFKGTFDGCMHTISGIYMNSDVRFSGFFARTHSDSKVKNLKIINSYFTSSKADLGSIAGAGYGTFDTIYSDAIVVSTAERVGGILGQLSGDNAMIKNCWFDGLVKCTGNTKEHRGVGGIVSLIHTENGVMSHCLNTGMVDASVYTYDQNDSSSVLIVPLAGGLIGHVFVDKKVTIDNCLNVGDVLVSNVATIGYGSIVGYSDGTVVSAKTYATSESCTKQSGSDNVKGKILVVSENEIKGYSGYQWTLLDFDKYWAVVLSDTPILKSFATEVPSLSGVDKMLDLSWYDENADTYILKDKGDLYGFAMLSTENTFKGKTVKLGNDIKINEGNASEWGEKAPQYIWTGIGSLALPFEGVFDGGMHSISGVYVNTLSRYQGLFSAVGESGTVKNLILTNSYFTSSVADLGSIVGIVRGTVDTIYTDAIVKGNASRIGGMFGQVNGKNVTIKNCWFDGSVINTGNSKANRGTGAIAGAIGDGKCSFVNCLNTGIVDVYAYTFNQTTSGQVINPVAGGIVGQVYATATSSITDCVNIGKIKYNSVATIGYGSIIGYAEGKTTITDVYATSESCPKHINGVVTGTVNVVSKDKIKGNLAKTNMPMLDWNAEWSTIEYGIPTLQKFKHLLIDTSWYAEELDTYLLKDRADLYGFAVLSKEKDFYGKTIKLVSDIVLNEGKAAEWELFGPSHEWIGIGTRYVTFSGTFDGGMHTISGLYVNTKERFQGLFSAVGSNGVVKNVRLENSFLSSTAADIGSIAGMGQGTFDSVYSNAIVHVATARVGGFIGQVSGTDIVIRNCWYDGVIKNVGNTRNDRGTGAIAGIVYSGKLTMTNCLNTGTVDVSTYTFNQNTSTTVIAPLAGGLVGQIGSGGSVELLDSLEAGKVLTSNVVTAGYGSVLGYSEGKITFSNVYATKESCKKLTGSNVTGTINAVHVSDIEGNGAKDKLNKLDFDKNWTVVLDGVPIPAVFVK